MEFLVSRFKILDRLRTTQTRKSKMVGAALTQHLARKEYRTEPDRQQPRSKMLRSTLMLTAPPNKMARCQLSPSAPMLKTHDALNQNAEIDNNAEAFMAQR